MKNTFATQKPSASEILKEIEDQKKKSSIIVPMIINRVFNIEGKFLPNIEWYKQYIELE